MKVNVSNLLILILALILLQATSPCATPKPLQKVNPTNLDEILTKPCESWTIDDCNRVIDYFTAFNQEGYNQKLSDYGARTEDVFVKATPLNKHVIAARMRKEAINRRLPTDVFRERLKVELEAYTNSTVQLESGAIKPKALPPDSLLKEYSFLLYFENISVPHRNIEIYRAEEGFFFENNQGEFTRAIDFWGYEIAENFVLITDLKATITFSAFTDEGKELVFNKETMKNYKLVFNGLQSKPVIVAF